jgi:hypothetical protein
MDDLPLRINAPGLAAAKLPYMPVRVSAFPTIQVIISLA